MATTPRSFEAMLEEIVRTEVSRIIGEETKKACERVQERIAQVADKLALSVLSSYNIERKENHIVITVNKKD